MAIRPLTLVAPSALVLGIVGSAAGQPALQPLTPIPGTGFHPRAVAPNGSAVVGTTGFGDPDRVWRWREGSGFEDLTPTFNVPAYWVVAASAGGEAIVGKLETGDGEVATRWTAAGGVQQLGFLPMTIYSHATGISGDGSVVVGSSGGTAATGQRGDRAFRWTVSTGMTPLFPLAGRGPQSIAEGISRDGQVVVGASGDNANGGTFQAARWLANGVPQSLGSFPGGFHSIALAVSSDGSVIAGNVQVVTNPPTSARSHPFRWTESGGMVDLGLMPGAFEAQTFAMNGDGSAIVGLASVNSVNHAFLWTEALGMVDLNSYLPTQGIDLTNWTLTSAIGVSDDGRTFIGSGFYDPVPGPGGGIGLGWVVTIPSPSAAPTCLLVTLVLAARRRRRVALPNLQPPCHCPPRRRAVRTAGW